MHAQKSSGAYLQQCIKHPFLRGQETTSTYNDPFPVKEAYYANAVFIKGQRSRKPEVPREWKNPL